VYGPSALSIHAANKQLRAKFNLHSLSKAALSNKLLHVQLTKERQGKETNKRNKKITQEMFNKSMFRTFSMFTVDISHAESDTQI